jgi:hypothetical protein
VGLTRHEDASVRWRALEALGVAGGVARSLIGEHLLPFMQDEDETVRSIAVWVAKGVGILLDRPELLEQLGELLCDADEDVRTEALEAAVELGQAVVTPRLLGRLEALLEDEEEGEQWRALQVVIALHRAVATPRCLRALADLLCSDNRVLQRETVRALENLGDIATTPPFLQHLGELLEDPGAIGRLYGLFPYWDEADDFLGRLAALVKQWEDEVSFGTRDSIQEIREEGPKAWRAFRERLAHMRENQPNRNLSDLRAEALFLHRLAGLLAEAEENSALS